MSEVAKKVELLMLAFSLKSKNEILNAEANILEEESQMLCVLGLKINDEETAEILVSWSTLSRPLKNGSLLSKRPAKQQPTPHMSTAGP